ncbi:uncharacterized protein LOC143468772 [Clavelina lepadiformis]|uniref:uncharacterized protein LOC143468772 n=1 Tax=Clavelina lepadiformis TaxID=159417 RepID=UPI00404214BE
MKLFYLLLSFLMLLVSTECVSAQESNSILDEGSISGDVRVKQYDRRKKIIFNKAGRFIATRTVDGTANNIAFEVQATFIGPPLTIIDEVIIMYQGETITLQRAMGLNGCLKEVQGGFDSTVGVNGRITHTKNGVFKIVEVNRNVCTFISNDNKLKIIFDGRKLTVRPNRNTYGGRMEGLLGNYDGNPNNDRKRRDNGQQARNFEEFALTWTL